MMGEGERVSEAGAKTEIELIDFKKMNNLVPAIVQDAGTGKVLMQGFMSRAAFDKTLESGLMTFYSRSRQKLWTKGEESGNLLKLVAWSADCDQDCLLFLVKPQGPTCHLGTESCFALARETRFKADENFLSALEEIIEERSREAARESYTAQLLGSGPKRVAQKVGEEGVELALALVAGQADEVINEAADLLYHLLVGLKTRDLRLQSVIDCLEARHTSSR